MHTTSTLRDSIHYSTEPVFDFFLSFSGTSLPCTSCLWLVNLQVIDMHLVFSPNSFFFFFPVIGELFLLLYLQTECYPPWQLRELVFGINPALSCIISVIFWFSVNSFPCIKHVAISTVVSCSSLLPWEDVPQKAILTEPTPRYHFNPLQSRFCSHYSTVKVTVTYILLNPLFVLVFIIHECSPAFYLVGHFILLKTCLFIGLLGHQAYLVFLILLSTNFTVFCWL